MKKVIVGLKEIEKGAKIYKKIEKLEKKLQDLAELYHKKTTVGGLGTDYYLNGVKDYIKRQKEIKSRYKNFRRK